MSDSRSAHEILLINRQLMRITGVVEVESFDSEAFLLNTTEGFLAIHGENLYMKNLNLEAGEVAIEGDVTDLMYMGQDEVKEKAKGFFSRLFR